MFCFLRSSWIGIISENISSVHISQWFCSWNKLINEKKKIKGTYSSRFAITWYMCRLHRCGFFFVRFYGDELHVWDMQPVWQVNARLRNARLISRISEMSNFGSEIYILMPSLEIRGLTRTLSGTNFANVRYQIFKIVVVSIGCPAPK